MKITTKLLLGATVVAGLSISAFAACATDVYMGNKQLKDVAAGSADRDAVNVAQVLKVDTASAIFQPTDYNVTGSPEINFYKVGKVCMMHGQPRVENMPAVTDSFILAPDGFRPLQLIKFPVVSTDKGVGRAHLSTGGEFYIHHNSGLHEYMPIYLSYICN